MSDERYLRITMTDNGETWGVDIDRQGVEPTDPDICDLLAQFNAVLQTMHRDAMIAKDLTERRN